MKSNSCSCSSIRTVLNFSTLKFGSPALWAWAVLKAFHISPLLSTPGLTPRITNGGNISSFSRSPQLYHWVWFTTWLWSDDHKGAQCRHISKVWHIHSYSWLLSYTPIPRHMYFFIFAQNGYNKQNVLLYTVSLRNVSWAFS